MFQARAVRNEKGRMTATEHTPREGYERKVRCECGVTLDLRTQGLLCPPCRARFRRERKRNMAAAWERYHRRHNQPTPSDLPETDVESLLDAVDRLVRALEAGRFGSARPEAAASRFRPARRAPQPHGAGGVSLDDLGAE